MFESWRRIKIFHSCFGLNALAEKAEKGCFSGVSHIAVVT